MLELSLHMHVVRLLAEFDNPTVNLMHAFYIAINCFFGLSLT